MKTFPDRRRGAASGGRPAHAVSFPVGGIGAGCIGVAGNGDLAEWEVFNRPAKGVRNGLSHFAVRAEREDGGVVDARILHGDFAGELSGAGDAPFAGFGYGPDADSLCGLPHFRSVSLRGEFPVGEWFFRDPRFPGDATLTAWSPFVPGRSEVSSLPCAVFEIALRNRAREPLVFSVVGCLATPWSGPAASSRVLRRAGRTVLLHRNATAPDSLDYGELALTLDTRQTTGDKRTCDLRPATCNPTGGTPVEVSRQTSLYRGSWCDKREVYWHDLTAPGPFHERKYAGPGERGDAGLLAARFHLAPGESRTVRFVVSWFVLNRTNDWTPPDRLAAQMKESGVARNLWRNYYAEALCSGAADAAARLLRGLPETRAQVFAFRDALHRRTTIPPASLEGAAATLSVLVSPTVLRLPDGALWGWEGVAAKVGSCEGSCQHVWNYEQATALLFPDLARSMREQQFRFNFDPDGGLLFRQPLPPGVCARRSPWFRPCVDGTMGEVLKTFREWRISGDTAWLRSVWPAAKKALSYAWSPENPDRWDPEKSGVLTGRQHHTLDMELFGPTAWLEGLYLAALRAAAQMARAVGEDAFAAECAVVYGRGRAWTEAHLFNGEYYAGEDVSQVAGRRSQVAGPKSKVESRTFALQLETPPKAACDLGLETLRGFGPEAAERYWDAEHREVKYQIGGGLSIDAHLGSLWAALYGVADDLLDPRRLDATLRAILRHNFKPSMREAANTWRVFAADDEAGTVMVSWPKGRRRPVIPIPYHSECMTGFEWAFATHLAWRGLMHEAETVAAAIRARYDGAKRNPWNEIECGSNYARAMAAYGMLQAFSGFHYDMTRGEIGFALRLPGAFSCFWSLGRAWGVYSRTASGRQKIEILFGSLTLSRLAVAG
ncbi:MAG: hypothetical protein IJL06_01060, partial [Kiritimatiellae bacterium]|nr:hypothetical protein [Kiritimatiellia bacterium]